jgi:hypothetical protein
MTRRRALAVGTTGTGAIAGCTAGPLGTEQEETPARRDATQVAGSPEAVGDPSRPLVSNEITWIEVPGDYDTIQGALDDIPLLLRHHYTIEVEPGYESEEDLFVPPTLARGQVQAPEDSFSTNGVDGRIKLRNVKFPEEERDPDPAEIKINSFTASSLVGVQLRFQDFTVTGRSPYKKASQNIGCMVFGSNEVMFKNIAWEADGERVGIHPYASNVEIRQCNFDGLQNGVWAKRESVVTAQRCSGKTAKPTYRCTNGGYLNVYDDRTENHPTEKFTTGYGGLAYMADTPRMAVMGTGPSQGAETVSLITLDSYLRDDFGDEDPQDRAAQRWGSYPSVSETGARFRPTWSDRDGGVTIGDGVMTIPPGERADTDSDALSGTWESSFWTGGNPSDSNLELYLVRNGKDWLRVEFAHNGRLALKKNQGGEASRLGGRAKWNPDADFHEVAVSRTRTPGGPRFHVEYGGETVITASDDFVPEGDRFRFQNWWDVPVGVSDFRVY